MSEWWDLDVTYKGYHVTAKVIGDRDKHEANARRAIDWWIAEGSKDADAEYNIMMRMGYGLSEQ